VEAVILLVVLGLAILLMTRRWFWVLAFFVAGLASAFTVLASIIHFQIFAAVGFFFLTIICWSIMAGIA